MLIAHCMEYLDFRHIFILRIFSTFVAYHAQSYDSRCSFLGS